MRPTYYLDQQAAMRDVLRGRRTELTVALELLVRGCTVRLGDIHAVERTDAVDYATEFDVEANGVPLEVKGRDLSFTSADDFPFPTIFLGSTAMWRAKKRAGTLPVAVVVVSEKTGAMFAVPLSTADQWAVDLNGRDVVTGESTPSLAAPRGCAQDFDDLVEYLRGEF